MANELNVNTGDPLFRQKQMLDQDIQAQNLINEDLSLPENGSNNLLSQITASSILNAPVESATPEEMEAINRRAQALSPETGELGALPSSVLYPGLKPVTQVGSVSGRVIGSQPIFGGGPQVFPIGAALERQRKLAEAAAAKAKAISEIKLPDSPKFQKALRFQRGLDQQFDAFLNDYFDRAKNIYGSENAKIALTSPETRLGAEFQSGLRSMETLVKEGDQIADLMANMDEAIAGGTEVFSDEALKLRNDFNSLQEDLVGEDGIPDPNKLAELVDKYQQLKGMVSLDTVLNKEKLNDIKGELVKVSGVSDYGEYLKMYTKESKDFERDVDIIIGDLVGPGGSLRPHILQGFLTEDQIKKHLKARLGTVDKSDVSVKFRPKGSGDSLQEDDVVGISESTTSGIYTQYDDQGNPTNEFELNLKTGDNFPTSTKKLDATGLEMIVDGTGQTKKLPGTAKVTFVKTGAITVNRTDMGGKRTVQEPVVIMNVEDTVTVPDTDKEGETIWKVAPEYDDQGNVVKEGEPVMVEKKITYEAPIKWNDNVEDLMLKNKKNIGLSPKAAEKIKKDQKDALIIEKTEVEVKEDKQPQSRAEQLGI